MGIALSVAVYAAVQAYAANRGADAPTAFLRGYHAAMLWGALLAAAGGVLSAKRE